MNRLIVQNFFNGGGDNYARIFGLSAHNSTAWSYTLDLELVGQTFATRVAQQGASRKEQDAPLLFILFWKQIQKDSFASLFLVGRDIIFKFSGNSAWPRGVSSNKSVLEFNLFN